MASISYSLIDGSARITLSASECRVRTAPVVTEEELLPRQSLRIDLATPCEVAAICVVAVFNSVLSHIDELAYQMFVCRNSWERSDQRLACIRWLVCCANAGDAFEGGSHFISSENFSDYW